MAAAPVTSRNSDASSAGKGRASLLLEHFGAILMALTDFVMFQTVAVLLCVAIYFTIPALDASIREGDDDWPWIDIFRIVSPTFTVSGGAVTVLTSYFFARKSQEEAKLRQEAEARAATAEAQVETLKSQLDQATSSSRRRNRRRLRNGPSQRGR